MKKQPFSEINQLLNQIDGVNSDTPESIQWKEGRDQDQVLSDLLKYIHFWRTRSKSYLLVGIP